MYVECHDSYRQISCHAANCGEVFFVCSRCERGQRYCSDNCRKYVRRIQQRAANRRHQQSEEGRLDHRDRQRAYRQRRAERRVTDHSYEPTNSHVSINPADFRPLAKRFFSIRTKLNGRVGSVNKALTCHICGRRGRLINPFHGLRGRKL